VRTANRTRILFAAIVLVVALAANFGYMALDHAWQMDDSPTYIGPAQNLAHGSGFRNVYGLVETRRTPGYPLFLMPFIALPNSLIIIVALQHLINAGLAVGVYFFSLHVLDDAAAALAGGIFLALDIPSLVHANMIVTETLFTALTFVVFAILARRGNTSRSAAVAGFVAGASVLVRPIALYAVVPSIVVIASERRPGRIVRALAFTVCFLLLPMAWSARNAMRGGGFSVSTITSWSLLFDRAASTLAIGDPGDFGVNLVRRRNELARKAGDPAQATYSNHVIRPIDHFHSERYSSLALPVIVRHPLSYLHAYALALARTVFGGGARQLQEIAGVSVRTSQMTILCYTITTTMIATLIWPWRRRRWWRTTWWPARWPRPRPAFECR
jgi:4-amino-4-deoxy-L-arabinose transferase-like glycosyltransferase